MKLTELTAPLGVEPEEAWGDVLITGICEDSRKVSAGDLFVAIPGTKVDGGTYASDAADCGAVAVVAERALDLPVPTLVVSDARRALALLAARFFGSATEQLHTVAVTGTNGKTTVCHWIAHLLGPERCEVISTVENERRGIRALTTPSSPVIHQIARKALDARKACLIVEASSIGLEQRRLDAIAFDVAAFTNLTHDHLDLHGSFGRYLEAKEILFRGLAPDAWAVVNQDDPCGEAILDATPARPFTVRRDGPADLTAGDITVGLDRCTFRLAHRGRTQAVRLPAAGLHSVDNALVAAGVAFCFGLSLPAIAAGLETVPRIPGRGDVYRDGRGVTAIVDFAHNPDALERILGEVRSEFERIVVVFGAPGESDRAKRPKMGRIAGRWADLTILTTDNPKGESPRGIIEEIARGVSETGGGCERIVDRGEAIARAVAQCGPRDLVLIAGKGHETYQIVGEEFIPHADGAVLGALGFEPAAASEQGEARKEI